MDGCKVQHQYLQGEEFISSRLRRFHICHSIQNKLHNISWFHSSPFLIPKFSAFLSSFIKYWATNIGRPFNQPVSLEKQPDNPLAKHSGQVICNGESDHKMFCK